MTFRRYRAMKARQLAAEGQTSVAAAFEAKRRASPGTPLPEDFLDARTRAALLAATPVPYDTLEDLELAPEAELTRVPGIGPATARRIIAAVEAWRDANPA